MTLSMTDEERLHRGTRAKEVLENEEFQAAFQAIEEELTNAWKTSPQRDSTAAKRAPVPVPDDAGQGATGP
jgi:hypothetical protein